MAASRSPFKRSPELPDSLWLALLVLITGAGLFLRVFDLSTIPPGLHFDQAANGLLGLEILAGREHPVFFPSYTGREALFMYLIAALSAVLGPGVMALRLAGALSGVAAIVAVAFFGASLFNRRIGLAASAFLAGLYWHIHISRLGERTILVPLLDTLALFALWEAFRRRSVALAALGGALVGLQLYTYPSSRFFVVALVLIAVVEGGGFVVERYRHRQVSANPFSVRRATLLLGVALIAAVLATIPLAVHFWHAPGDFLGRADQVAIWNARVAGGSPLSAFLRSAKATLLMFAVRGDSDWKYNLANRPVFDPVSAILFVLGLILALWRWRDRSSRVCLVWWGCMLVPGFLSVEAPQFMRTLGAAPPAVIFAALGLQAVIERARSWAVPREVLARAVGLLWLWPVAAGVFAGYQYFRVWAPSPAAYLALEGDVTAATRVIETESPRYVVTYVASRYGPNPTISYLDGTQFERLRWFDGRVVLPLPPPNAGPSLYVLPRTAVDPTWYDRLPSSDRVALVAAPDNRPAVEAFVLRPDELKPSASLEKPPEFGQVARLVGADVPSVWQAGVSIAPAIFWQVIQPPPGEIKFWAHLVDASGYTWAQYDEAAYPAQEWQTGQTLIVRHPIAVPVDAPPGKYTLVVGLERSDGTPLPAMNAAGKSLGSFWTSPKFGMARPAQPPEIQSLAIQQPLDVTYGDSLRLVGANLDQNQVLDGDDIAVTLFWKVLRAPGPVDLSLQLAAPGQVPFAQSTRPPAAGVWPSTEWRPGDVVADRETLHVPVGAPVGNAALLVGVRDGAGHVLSPAGGAAVQVGAVTIRRRPHPAVTVTISHSQVVPFAAPLRLVGYDVSTTSVRAGAKIHLTLYWQADAPLGRSWTVFTHLLRTGDHIVAQQDGIPVGGQRPTTTWEPGEIIVDPHDLTVDPHAPSGVDRLEIGLYDARTGKRLALAAGGDRILLDRPIQVK